MASEFPEYYTIDALSLDSLSYFLTEEFEGETVLITVTREKDVSDLDKLKWKNKGR